MFTKIETGLKHVRFYLPSKQRDGKTVNMIEHGVCSRLVEIGLSEMFGGFTAHTAMGGWHDGSKTVTESVTVYESGVTRDLTAKEEANILRIGEEILRRLNQAEARIEACGSVYTLSMP